MALRPKSAATGSSSQRWRPVMYARMFRRAAIAVVLPILAACSGCVLRTAVAEPTAYVFGAQRLSPEGWWEDVYEVVEECAGSIIDLPPNREYSDIVWLIVPEGAMGYIAGLWSPPHRIFL